MPYKVERGHGCPVSRPWACINESTGQVHGCHATKEDGLKQAAALYANTDDESKSALPAGEEERAAMTLASHHVQFLDNMLRNHTEAVQATHDHIAAYEDSTTALPGLTEAIVSANEDMIGRIQTVRATGSGGSTSTSTSGTTSSGGGSKGQGQGQAGRSDRELVESVMRDLVGARKPNDDLGDAEFLYGFTAQLREAQDVIAGYRSDNPEVRALLESVAASNADHIAAVRRLAWSLGGGTDLARSPAVDETETKPAMESTMESTSNRAQADRELLESVLYPDDRKQLTSGSRNDLPDSAFAYIEPGGKKDASGRTTPRSLRHFPIHDAAHVRNALARIAQGAKFGAQAKPKVMAAARKFGISAGSQSNSATRLDIDVVRFVDLIPEFRDDRHGDVLGVLRGHFSVFDNWYPVSSKWEGDFIERMERTAFDDTIANDRDQMRSLFDHGFDPSIGNKVLGPIIDLRADDRGAYYEVELLDTAYNRELLPGLKRNVYGASMRMRVHEDGDHWDERPTKSSYNPNGVKERSISRAKVMEFGPVTFPANPAATAMARSATDWFYDSLRSKFPASFDEALRRAGGALPPAVLETYALDGFTPEAAFDAVLDTDLTGRSAQGVDGGDSETESSSDRGSTYVDEFAERIDHLRFREIKMRHADAYVRAGESTEE